MSQAEILKLLKKYPKKWFTSKDIANFMGIAANNTAKKLTKLRHFGFIISKPLHEGNNNRGFYYKYK